jgi:hypothetical protein
LEEKRLLRVGAFDPDQMPVGRDESEECVFEARGEEGQRNDLRRVLGVDPLERRRIALADHRVDMGSELAIEENMDPLGRDQPALRVGGLGIGVGEKFGQQHHQVEQDHSDGPSHRQAVHAKAQPHQLRLGGDRYPLLGVGRQQGLPPKPPSTGGGSLPRGGVGRERTGCGDGRRGRTGGLLGLERRG